MKTHRVSLILAGSASNMEKVLISHNLIECTVPSGPKEDQAIEAFQKLLGILFISLDDFDININDAIPPTKIIPGNNEAYAFLLEEISDATNDVRMIHCMNDGDLYFMYEIWLADRADLWKLRNFGKKTIERLDEIFNQHLLSQELQDYIKSKLLLIESRTCAEYPLLTGIPAFKALAELLKPVVDISEWRLSHFVSVVNNTKSNKGYYPKYEKNIPYDKRKAVDEINYEIECFIKKTIYFNEMRLNILSKT